MAMRARCRGGDSNSHALRHLILSQARIPFRHPGFIFFSTKKMEARAGLGHGSRALPRVRPRPHLAALAAPAARATLRLSPPDETRVRAFLPCHKKTLRVFWRLGRDSNPRIAVLSRFLKILRPRGESNPRIRDLQSHALPLGYAASISRFFRNRGSSIFINENRDRPPRYHFATEP